MSPNPRAFRLADQIQFEVSDIIRNSLRDPRKGFITITAVEVADDLRSAKIFVSALGDASALTDTLSLLDHARGFIRSELASRIKVRFVPEIHFRADDSATRGVHMDKLLRDLREGKLPDEDAEPDES